MGFAGNTGGAHFFIGGRRPGRAGSGAFRERAWGGIELADKKRGFCPGRVAGEKRAS